MKRSILVGLLSGVVAFWALSLLRPRPAPGEVARISVTDAYIRPADLGGCPDARRPYLDLRVPEVTGKVTLARLAQIVGRATDRNVVINYRAIEAAGFEESTEAELELRNATVRQVIRVALDDLGGFVIGLDYAIDDAGGVIHISTRQELLGRMTASVYDVRDLIAAQPFPRGAPEPDPTLGGGSGGRFRSARGGGGGFSGRVPPQPPPVDERADELLVLIREMVDPSTWSANGGRSRMSIFDGVLLITAHEDVHHDIAELLARLRLALAAREGMR